MAQEGIQVLEYLWDRPCPKCGAANSEGASGPSRVGTVWLPPVKPYSARFKRECLANNLAEHYERHCDGCGYQWCEAMVEPTIQQEE